MNSKSSIYTSGGTHEWKYKFGLHEWNKIRPYPEKIIFYFCNAFIYNN